MWVVAGLCVAAAVTLTATLLLAARRPAPPSRGEPWLLYDTAKLHVAIMGTLAGFAVTGLVLIVSLSRAGLSGGPQFDTVVVMFMTSYLFYIGNAFLISYLPHRDAAGELVPRLHFTLASTIEYRTLFISWFALRPLLETYHLGRPAAVLSLLLPASLILGSTIVAAAADGLGLVRVKETYLAAVLGMAATLAYAAVVWLAAPGARSETSALSVTVVIFFINGAGFALAALTSLAPRYGRLAALYSRQARRIAIADMQVTMVALPFLWLAVIGVV